jgi:hypothetical protein
MRIRIEERINNEKTILRYRINETLKDKEKLLDASVSFKDYEGEELKNLMKSFIHHEFGQMLASGATVEYDSKKEDDIFTDLIESEVGKYENSTYIHSPEINFGGTSQPKTREVKIEFLRQFAKELNKNSDFVSLRVINLFEDKRMMGVASFFSNGILVKENRKIKSGTNAVLKSTERSLDLFLESLYTGIPKRNKTILEKDPTLKGHEDISGVFNKRLLSLNVTSSHILEDNNSQTRKLIVNNARKKLLEVNERIEKELKSKENNVFFIDGGEKNNVKYSGYIQKLGDEINTETLVSNSVKGHEETAFLLALGKVLKTKELRDKKTIFVCDGDIIAAIKEHLDNNLPIVKGSPSILSSQLFKEVKELYKKSNIDLNMHYIKSHNGQDSFAKLGNHQVDKHIKATYEDLGKKSYKTYNWKNVKLEELQNLTIKNNKINDIKAEFDIYLHEEKGVNLTPIKKARQASGMTMKNKLYITIINDRPYVALSNQREKVAFVDTPKINNNGRLFPSKLRLMLGNGGIKLWVSEEALSLIAKNKQDFDFLDELAKKKLLKTNLESNNKDVLKTFKVNSNTLVSTVVGKQRIKEIEKSFKDKLETPVIQQNLYEKDLTLYYLKNRGKPKVYLHSKSHNKIWEKKVEQGETLPSDILNLVKGRELNIVSFDKNFSFVRELNRSNVEALKKAKDIKIDVIEDQKFLKEMIKMKLLETGATTFDKNIPKNLNNNEANNEIIKEKKENVMKKKDDLNNFVKERFTNELKIKIENFYGNESLVPNKILKNDTSYIIMKFGNKTMNIHKFENGTHVMERYPQDFKDMNHLESFLTNNAVDPNNKIMISLNSNTALSDFGQVIRGNNKDQFPIVSSLLKRYKKENLLFTKTSEFQFKLIENEVKWYTETCIDFPSEKPKKENKSRKRSLK